MACLKKKHKWADIPRTVVHDKPSYMATPAHDCLQIDFADGLRAGGFRSWVGDRSDSAKWLVKKFGDVYLHETAIAHIRRLLDGDFAHNQLHETRAHFAGRMRQVQEYTNSPSFAACGGQGLMGLAKDLRTRCELVVSLQGECVPK